MYGREGVYVRPSSSSGYARSSHSQHESHVSGSGGRVVPLPNISPVGSHDQQQVRRFDDDFTQTSDAGPSEGYILPQSGNVERTSEYGNSQSQGRYESTGQTRVTSGYLHPQSGDQHRNVDQTNEYSHSQNNGHQQQGQDTGSWQLPVGQGQRSYGQSGYARGYESHSSSHSGVKGSRYGSSDNVAQMQHSQNRGYNRHSQDQQHFDPAFRTPTDHFVTGVIDFGAAGSQKADCTEQESEHSSYTMSQRRHDRKYKRDTAYDQHDQFDQQFEDQQSNLQVPDYDQAGDSNDGQELGVLELTVLGSSGEMQHKDKVQVTGYSPTERSFGRDRTGRVFRTQSSKASEVEDMRNEAPESTPYHPRYVPQEHSLDISRPLIAHDKSSSEGPVGNSREPCYIYQPQEAGVESSRRIQVPCAYKQATTSSIDAQQVQVKPDPSVWSQENTPHQRPNWPPSLSSHRAQPLSPEDDQQRQDDSFLSPVQPLSPAEGQQRQGGSLTNPRPILNPPNQFQPPSQRQPPFQYDQRRMQEHSNPRYYDGPADLGNDQQRPWMSPPFNPGTSDLEQLKPMLNSFGYERLVQRNVYSQQRSLPLEETAGNVQTSGRQGISGDGMDPWVVDHRPYPASVTEDTGLFESGRRGGYDVQVTTAAPSFWNKLGHRITKTYDKAKEKAKEIFG